MSSLTIKQERKQIQPEKVEVLNFSSPRQSVMDQPQMMVPNPLLYVGGGASVNSASNEGINAANAPKDMHTTGPAQNGTTASPARRMGARVGPQSVNQPTQIDESDLYGASPANPNRPGTRNYLKRTIAYEEEPNEESDDEGGQDKAKRQRRLDRTSPLSHVKIGHHTKEPLVGVFAKLRSKVVGNGKIHVYARKSAETPAVFSSGKSWRHLVHQNGQVSLADLTLDPELFPGYEDKLDHIPDEEKRQIVFKYLSSVVIEGQQPQQFEAIDTLTPDPQAKGDVPIYRHRTPFIVGFHQDYPAIPVRAQLRIQYGYRAAVLFKLEAAEVKENQIILPKLSVQDAKVKFSPEFARPTPEETKAEILTRFLVKDSEPGHEEVIDTPTQRPLHRQDRSGRKSRTRSGKEVTRPPRIALPAGCADGVDGCLKSLQDIGKSFFSSAFEYGENLKTREAVVLEKETALSEKVGMVERREQNMEQDIIAAINAALNGEETSIKELQKQVEQLEKAKAEDNARMLEQIEQLTAQLVELRKKASTSYPSQASTYKPTATNSESSSFSLNLNGMKFSQAYTKIPEGNPNTGWYWQNHSETVVNHEGPFRGKKFARNQVLQPIVGITVPGSLKGGALRCEGIEHLHYEENGIAKLVQNSESIVQHEGQFYVCWTYLREIKEPVFKF